jgi:transcriptional regulator with XRE-family HTH domain
MKWRHVESDAIFDSRIATFPTIILLLFRPLRQNNGIMAKKTAPLLPSTDALLAQLGARLRIARLRRKLPAKQLAERAGMSPMTLRSIERGGAGVTLGAYAAVMQVLGLERDFEFLAQADPVGRELQDSRLPAPRRAAPVPVPAPRPASPKERPSVVAAEPGGPWEAPPGDWATNSGFASSEALSALIKRRSSETGS